MVDQRRFLRLSGASIIGQDEIVIEIRSSEFGTSALELVLLSQGLAESLRLKPVNKPDVLLTVVREDQRSKAQVVSRTESIVHFDLGQNQVEYLAAFLLRAYRDHMAPVNHVHIEGQDRHGMLYDLTVLVDVSKPPLSPEELARRLKSFE